MALKKIQDKILTVEREEIDTTIDKFVILQCPGLEHHFEVYIYKNVRDILSTEILSFLLEFQLSQIRLHEGKNGTNIWKAGCLQQNGLLVKTPVLYQLSTPINGIGIILSKKNGQLQV